MLDRKLIIRVIAIILLLGTPLKSNPDASARIYTMLVQQDKLQLLDKKIPDYYLY